MRKNQSNPLDAEPSKSSGVLVTGGSGYIGSGLVQNLSSRGDTVVSMYRHRLPEPQENVFPVCSDLSCEELLAAPLRGIDVVVHLAWDKTLVGSTKDLSHHASGQPKRTKNLRLLAHLISAMEKAQTRRIVFLSALGAAEQANDSFLEEKYRGEILVLNSKIPERIVVRPGIIYGGDERRDRFLNSIRWLMRFPGLYPLPYAKTILYPLHITDLVSLIASYARDPIDQPVRLFEVRGKEAVAVEEVFRGLMDVEGYGSRIAIGSFLGKMLLPLFEKSLSKNSIGIKLSQYLRLGQRHLDYNKSLGVSELETKRFCTFKDGLNRRNHLKASHQV